MINFLFAILLSVSGIFHRKTTFCIILFDIENASQLKMSKERFFLFCFASFLEVQSVRSGFLSSFSWVKCHPIFVCTSVSIFGLSLLNQMDIKSPGGIRIPVRPILHYYPFNSTSSSFDFLLCLVPFFPFSGPNPVAWTSSTSKLYQPTCHIILVYR